MKSVSDFREYHSMENIQKKDWINSIRNHSCAQAQWILLEKIHGANFQIWTDGEEVKVGKRTSFLVPYEVKFLDKTTQTEITKLCDP